jgi:hypothetical protein
MTVSWIAIAIVGGLMIAYLLGYALRFIGG